MTCAVTTGWVNVGGGITGADRFVECNCAV